jgi:hypothetical protein
MASIDGEVSAVRDLTDDEVRIFHEQGWVFVKEYVNRDHVARMLERAKERMAISDGEQFDPAKVASVKNWWWEVSYIAREEEPFAAIGYSSATGRNIQRLFQRDVAVHYLADSLMAKAPMARSDGSGPTSWHQDIPSFPFDRSGTMACWLALDHLTPDMGTMHFLEGSHRGEFYGRVPASEDPEAIFDYFPYLRDRYEEVPSPTFEPGDATFHHCQTVHGAPANTADRIRWSYTTAYMAADCRYTGASCFYTDGMNLPIEQPIRHPKFPRIWPAEG